MFIEFANLKLEIPEAPLRMTRPRLKVTPPTHMSAFLKPVGKLKGI